MRLRLVWVVLFALFLFAVVAITWTFAMPHTMTKRPSPIQATLGAPNQIDTSSKIALSGHHVSFNDAQTTRLSQSCTRWIPIESLQTSQHQDYYEANGQIYWTNGKLTQAVRSADAATFVISPPGAYDLDIAKDKSNVYSAGLIIPDADPTTFEELCTSMNAYSCYTKDKNEVLFYCGIGSEFPVRGADPATFMATSSSPNCVNNCFDAYDAKTKYWGGNPI